MTRAAALLALLAGAARAAVETHEVHASGSFGLLRRKHVNPERRLQTDYAPSAAPSEAPTFETWMPTAVGGKLGWCETYNSPRWTGGSCDDSGDPCSSNDDCSGTVKCWFDTASGYDGDKSTFQCGVTEEDCMGPVTTVPDMAKNLSLIHI